MQCIVEINVYELDSVAEWLSHKSLKLAKSWVRIPPESQNKFILITK